jgi:hypothetical protein
VKKHAPKIASASEKSWMRKRWLLIALPLLVFAGLIALAPTAPDRPEDERTDQAQLWEQIQSWATLQLHPR